MIEQGHRFGSRRPPHITIEEWKRESHYWCNMTFEMWQNDLMKINDSEAPVVTDGVVIPVGGRVPGAPAEPEEESPQSQNGDHETDFQQEGLDALHAHIFGRTTNDDEDLPFIKMLKEMPYTNKSITEDATLKQDTNALHDGEDFGHAGNNILPGKRKISKDNVPTKVNPPSISGKIARDFISCCMEPEVEPPPMPRRNRQYKHREKIAKNSGARITENGNSIISSESDPVAIKGYACVARPVNKKELAACSPARAAMDKQWIKLRGCQNQKKHTGAWD
jgi:hypothetical protein